MDHNKQVISRCFNSQQFIKQQIVVIEIRQPMPADLSYMVKNMDIKKVKNLRFCFGGGFSRSYIRPQAIKELAKGHWPCLEILQICNDMDIKGYSPELGDNGCKQLAKLRAKQLKQIQLWMCNIGDEGCLHLSRAKWPKLSTIKFNNFKSQNQKNQIGDEGFRYIVKADWNISELYLRSNNIGAIGIKQMKQAQWKYLLSLNLCDNKIGDGGCKWMSQTQSSCLRQLELQKNQISKSGCKWLSKSNWKEITKMFLKENQIYWEGCGYLSDCDWPRVTELQLDEGCILLMKSNWKNLKQKPFNWSYNIFIRQNRSIFQLYKKCFPLVA